MAPGVEMSDLNWLALAIAVVANIVIGFLWYSPKMPTGKVWMRSVGLKPDHKPEPKVMVKAMILMVVGSFLMMFVLAHSFVAYRDAYRLDEAGYDLGIMDGVMGAFFTWIGFFVPVIWGAQSWEGKPWSLFFVQAGYYLVSLLVAGILLVTV